MRRSPRRRRTTSRGTFPLRVNTPAIVAVIALAGFVVGALLSTTWRQSETPIEGAGNVVLQVTRSPVCPVETAPPAPECTPAPLADVTVVIVGLEGPIGSPRSTADGIIILDLRPGTYAVTPQPLEGFLTAAPAFELVVPPEGIVRHAITYDSGIR